MADPEGLGGSDETASGTLEAVEGGLDVITVQGRDARDAPLSPRGDALIELQNRPLRFETLGDVLLEAPGIHVFNAGGIAATQSVSVRGSEFDQVTVLVDDVPLVGPDRGQFDFGIFPLDGFQGVEVFYDSAPIRYGGGTIGGVIRLIPKRIEQGQAIAEAGAGSFDTYRTRGQIEAASPSFSGVLSGGYLRSDNDFFFLDDGGTLLGPEAENDDTVERRENAQVQRTNGFGYGTWESGPHRLALLGLVFHQEAGAPGAALNVSTESDEVRTQAFGSLGYRLRTAVAGMELDAFATAAVGRDRLRFRDPLGRIGLGQEDSRDVFLSVDARGGAFLRVAPWLNVGSTVFYRMDDLRPNDEFAVPGDQPSSRDTLTVAGEVLLTAVGAPIPMSLRTSVSGTFTEARISTSRLQETQVSEISDSVPFFRIEGRLEPFPWLELTSKVSSGIRLPTSLELFGNRNTIRGAFDLEPERSLAADAGVRLATTFGPLDVVVDASVFWRRVRDLILARRTSQFQITFENAREGETLGLEALTRFDLFDQLTFTTNVTWLDAPFDNRGFDRQQPLRIPVRVFHQTRVRFPISTFLNELSFLGEVAHRSGFFPDSANLVDQPSFTSINAGAQASFWADRFTFAVVGSNLTDARGIDLLGFPLMSRFIEATLRWRTDF
ncbi:MAG: TonB-dependent receptor [Myxococcota bacterium]